MTTKLPVTTAIIVADRPGVEDRLHNLFDQLAQSHIVATVVQDPDEATAQLVITDSKEVQCVLIEADGTPDNESYERILERIHTIAAVPDIEPILIGRSPTPSLVIQTLRAGGGDFIDLDGKELADVARILQRIADRYQERTALRGHVRGLRTALEDFLKNLVQTERRTIDLERQLAARQEGTEPLAQFDPDRAPAVLIIEDDREVADLLIDELEQAGLTTFAFVSGEEAVANVALLTRRGEAIDLALVDARLPGMDGLEAIRRMREYRPNLAAILMTGFSSAETAIGAADLGVVGYVLKPFDDIPALIKRIKERATQSMNSARERHYLTEIKQRHEKILLRYRKLAAELHLD
ncbi:MAG: response regulator [Proteobacteria bacterium]|nr:response regulator [Pseudomonadota bacterium]